MTSAWRRRTPPFCSKARYVCVATEDYAPILDMLKETLTSPAMPIVLDLRELDFLNSSGITMLSRFVMEARDHPGSTFRCWLPRRSRGTPAR